MRPDHDKLDSLALLQELRLKCATTMAFGPYDEIDALLAALARSAPSDIQSFAGDLRRNIHDLRRTRHTRPDTPLLGVLDPQIDHLKQLLRGFAQR